MRPGRGGHSLGCGRVTGTLTLPCSVLLHHMRTPGGWRSPRGASLQTLEPRVGLWLSLACVGSHTSVPEWIAAGVVHSVLSSRAAHYAHLGLEHYLCVAQESSNRSLCLGISFRPSRLRMQISCSGEPSLTWPGISSCPHITTRTYTHTCP